MQSGAGLPPRARPGKPLTAETPPRSPYDSGILVLASADLWHLQELQTEGITGAESTPL